VGQEEIRGNLGFKEERFQELMEAMGWEKGQAWCAYFGELVWKLAYSRQNGLFVSRLDKLFSASAVTTFKNFKKAGWPVHTGKNPKPGSLVVWQTYKNGKKYWTGHVGIYVEKPFRTIEGNTNNDGSREGYKVAEKTRTFNYGSKSGLVLLGFIEPKQP
jgi:hypothetical protein